MSWQGRHSCTQTAAHSNTILLDMEKTLNLSKETVWTTMAQ